MRTPISYFTALTDSRVNRAKAHLMEDIIFITIAAVICGAESGMILISTLTEGDVVSIDGKSICGSREGGSKRAVHIVSAWSDANQLSLGQVKVDDKSNEITAIPQLLNVLVLQGCLVTIDAMGCQRNIAAKIIEKGADYLLAVKGNRG